MHDEPESRGGSWLIYSTVLTVAMPIMYALSWGPVASLAERSTPWNDVAQFAYAPVNWLETNTALNAPLDWYWDLFAFIRPSLPSMNSNRYELQYFPPGPNFKLIRQVKALEEYRLRQQVGPPAEAVTDGCLPEIDDANESTAGL